MVVMKDGWVQQVGEPLELYNQPANRFVAGFIGSPAMNFACVRIANGAGGVWAESPAQGGMRIKVPDAMVPRVGKYVGHQLTLGIRPENLRVATGADSADLSFDANVEVVEQLGSEILLDVKSGTDQIVASVDPTIRTKSSEKLRLALNPDYLHFFDPKTEMAL